MEQTTIIGCVVLAVSITIVTVFTVWSRRTINWIAAKEDRSGREIVKELRGER